MVRNTPVNFCRWKPPYIPTHDKNRKLVQVSWSATTKVRTWGGQVLLLLVREAFRPHHGFPFGSGLTAERSVKPIGRHEKYVSRQIYSTAIAEASVSGLYVEGMEASPVCPCSCNNFTAPPPQTAAGVDVPSDTSVVAGLIH